MNISDNKQPDYFLLGIIFVLMTFGIIMVFSSSYIMAYKWYDNSYYFFNRQIINAFIAILAFIIALNIDYHFWQKVAIPVLILSIL
ncbi:MAG: FtsW/RodA/SpoVE family cell cycle protein, partial [Atribacterota bacterium]|nr:FtsW/RodA/SpoVE family cell cycle protein [Atribacterota bacterium]